MVIRMMEEVTDTRTATTTRRTKKRLTTLTLTLTHTLMHILMFKINKQSQTKIMMIRIILMVKVMDTHMTREVMAIPMDTRMGKAKTRANSAVCFTFRIDIVWLSCWS